MVEAKPVHSKIGASSMHRWAKCPGSVRLSEGLPSTSSKYAEEGTRAHEAAAHYLMNLEWPANIYLDDEGRESVATYVNLLLEDQKNTPKAIMHVEHRFDLSSLHKGLYGTADGVIFAPYTSELRVYDYKHGAGVAVDAVNNEQLMYYGLGAMIDLGYAAETVELIIVQPRCEHPEGRIRRWKFQSVELIDFAADLVDAAKRTEDPNAKLVPGDHCRFCPASGVCPKLHERANLVAKEEFSPQYSYDPAMLARTLEALPMVEAWAKSVREFAYREAMHGRAPKGFKLVSKRATRKWKDEDLLSQHVLKTSIPIEFFYESKLKSPAQMEKIKHFKEEISEVIKELAVAESSGFVLVPDTDPRPQAMLDAKSEFDKFDNEQNEQKGET